MQNQKPKWLDRVISPHILSIPPYVPGKPVAELVREMGLPDAIKMASNENPLGPSLLALKAVQRHLGQSHIYPEDSAPELRNALAEKHGVSPENVIIGNGSDEIMALASHVFLRPGDEAIMGENAFSMYRICAEAFQGKAVRVALKSHRSDLAKMAKRVTDRTRIIFLAIPNNPTGTIVSKAEFEAFLRDLPDEGLLLIVDEAYREYVTCPDCPNGIDYVNSEKPLLVLRTFSKIYGLAGLRVGYGIGSSWIIDLLNRVRPPFNVSSPAQVAAVAALEDEDHLHRSLKCNSEGMEYLVTELRNLNLEVVPSEANFITFCLGSSGKPIYEALLKEGVIIRHLASFGMENCLRVTVGTMHENKRFVSGLRKIIAAEK